MPFGHPISVINHYDLPGWQRRAGSQDTHRWRKRDSNPRALPRTTRPRSRKTGTEAKAGSVEKTVASGGPMVRISRRERMIGPLASMRRLSIPAGSARRPIVRQVDAVRTW